MYTLTKDLGHKQSAELFNQQVFKEGWEMDILSEPKSAVFCRGFEYLETKQDLLLALCLNNSYFKRENIYRLLKFALAFSDSVQIFTTDGPAKHNYRAFGRPESEVTRETRLERNHLRNLIRDALSIINSQLSPDQQKTVSFLDWEAIYADPAYQSSVHELRRLYETSIEFRKDVNDATTKVLLSRTGIKKSTKAILSEGVQYVFEEVGFILSYTKLLPTAKPIPEHGVRGFNYIYHESWPILEKLVHGAYGNKPEDSIGFVIAKIES